MRSRTDALRSRSVALRARRTELWAFGGLFAACLLAFVSIGAALPVLPLFVRGPLHASNFAVGIVVGAFSVTSVFCRPLAGRFADNRGRKIVLVVSAFVMSLGGVLYLLAGSIASLILARLVVGMGEGALYTAGATWAVDLAPVRHRGLALGVFGLAVWGGLSLGPLVGEVLRSGAGLRRRLGAGRRAPARGCPDRAVPAGAGPRVAGARETSAWRCSRARRGGRGSPWRSPTSAMPPWPASWCST